ncbi:hypothetical protein HanIR_Chr11g0517821 [Helianthus annuus]|nr:hypothetical protein HanIR_Chr11g0517821 [Helianthus annuus]
MIYFLFHCYHGIRILEVMHYLRNLSYLSNDFVTFLHLIVRFCDRTTTCPFH